MDEHAMRMHMLRASRCMIDASFAPRSDEPVARQKSNAFVYFRFVQGMPLAKALKATNQMFNQPPLTKGDEQ